jgi:RpiB/LacA/LacB family sugar-phosphate isomerase
LRIFIGADHRGVAFKEKIKKILGKLKVSFKDVGTFDPDVSCDYPKIAYDVATHVAGSKNSRGILVCMSGIGQAMAANKVPGAYAALCYNVESAKLSRAHNNANILVLGAKFVRPTDIERMVKVWLLTEFEGGRHLRRVNLMKKIEQGKKI